MTWFELAQEFQTAIVGAIGFAGVILTLIANFRIEAKTSARETRKRAAAVATLVEAELRLLLGAMLLGSEIRSDDAHSHTQMPRLRLRFSNLVLNDLGLLESDLCRKIVLALSTVDNVMAKVRITAESETAEYFSVPSKNCALVAKIYLSHSKVLEEALEALDEFRRANA